MKTTTTRRKAGSTRNRGPRLAFVGAGAAATALAGAAVAAGIPVSGFSARSLRSARRSARATGAASRAFADTRELAAVSDLIVLAVPDRAIAAAAEALAPHIGKRHVVCHLSGALGSSVLRTLGARGAAVASFHPIQTFPGGARGSACVAGSHVAIEGDATATSQLFRLARRLGLRPFAIPAANRARYHASAVLASNAVVALFDLAVELFARSTGQTRVRAEAALGPLFASAAANIVSRGIPGALSGPVARGDLPTIERHLRALRRVPAPIRRAYEVLSGRAVDVALRKGTITPSLARALRALLARRPVR